MKTNILKTLLVTIIMAVSTTANAYDIEVDGLRYNILSEADRTVEVANHQSVSGNLEIPEKIVYDSETYTVTTIGERAFSECYGLTSVTIPNSVTSIGDKAFFNCGSLTSVTIPSSVTTISNSTFSGCIGLTSVTIPSSVTTIGNSAFDSCRSLTSVTIPSLVTSIGEYTFCDCRSLTSVTIPNSVTSIGYGAFSGCSGLTSVTIPNSVTTIGRDAFDDCRSLKSIYCQWTEPFECNPSFEENVYKDAVLYVPVGCTSAYKAVNPWSNFLNIEEIDYSGIGDVADDGIEVKVIAGDIVAEGCTEMEVYSMSGQLMYRGCAGRVENLAPGIYVVHAGGKTVKAMVAR